MARSLNIYISSTILGLKSISVGKRAFISTLRRRQKIKCTYLFGGVKYQILTKFGICW